MKYLQYGGVTVGPNVGGGVGAQEVKEMDKDDALRARSKTAVFLTQSELEVDFNAVVRGYLYGANYETKTTKLTSKQELVLSLLLPAR